MKNSFALSLTAVAVLLAGCATPVAKPAFYPNAHYQQVGPAQAQADAQACATMAQQSDVGAVNRSDAGRAAAAGAAGVGAAGVVGSLLSGHKPDLRDIAAGAAAVGVGGAAATAAGQSVGGNPMYRQFVQQCLAERGYHVIGWN
jgi:hypothetical protein